MNNTFKIEITNLEKLQNAFKSYPSIAGPEFAKSINIVLQNILTKATDEDNGIFQFKTPRVRRTGYLSLSFGQGLRNATPSNLTGSIGPTVFYAKYVENGTPAHIIRAINSKALANKKAGQIFGRVVHHPGTKANPFMERIRDINIETVNNEMSGALKRVVAQIAL